MGFILYLADNRRQVVEALDLPPEAVADDPSLAGGWHPARVDLTVPISADAVDAVEQMVHEQVNQGTNFICLWIDCPGGPVDQAMRLANYLASLDPGKVRTVAYIPEKALSDAAVVAFSCDQIVVCRRAQLGGPGEYEPNAAEIDDMQSIVAKEIAPRKGRSWSLAVALVDPRLTVYRVRRRGETDYLCDAELAERSAAERPGAARWEKEDEVTTPGKALRLSGIQADEYRLASHVVENFEEFGRYFGLKPEDIRKVEPGWADALIKAMASPGVALLLLFIGAVGLWVELHHPGTGVGAFVAVVCFLLFFWSHYLGGTAGWLQATLFLAGTCCVLLEVFVLPGLGIFGLGGGAMILASIVLASQTFVVPRNEYQFDQLETSLLTVAGAAVGLVAFAVLVRHRLPRSRLFGHIMLEPPAGEEAEFIRQHEALADFRALLGARGTTTTLLMPAGKARFGDQVVDVIADGEMIDRGATVEIVEVRGARVLVKKVGQ
jgi:membrane-bound ClpP family serine protease